ncbi:1-phosphofructokinase family hexose kinase [Gulosibacter molinativorax]|uniref:1-phosphofructokinase n=1 Tax=Gulosibacter molinativorax TaxID=256821 RepID=A0ABT7C9V3_9MICO|nr:1-phosphofructokinase family hexose kinase [Gulosibacter molinativorax]MDJ1371973.1 1-phosphofructokinase [Gulosibacter molinativorax]QUY62663.1 1-phosphofructokinase [Gulosibacter molinativorax]
MIITATPNPSIDRTVKLDRPLERGGVHRLSRPVDVAGGKGINVARVLGRAGIATRVLVPAPEGSDLVRRIEAEGLDLVRTSGPEVRTNLTLVEADGTTTKLNEPGGELAAEDLQELERAIMNESAATSLAAAEHTWVVLAGSLPQGVAPDWYLRMTAKLRLRGVRVAVDTSDAPIRAFAESDVLPNLMKPNGAELATLTGNATGTGLQLEAAAAAGDFEPVLAAARTLHRRGCEAVLVTLGAAGALLFTEDTAWVATPPPITVRSTVGAGDSSLAGYLSGVIADADPARRLELAVASGAAAASLPGTEVPTSVQLDLEHTHSRALHTRDA